LLSRKPLSAKALAAQVLQEHPEALKRLDRVADLINGFETPFGMELLSTVHWLAVHEGIENVDAAIPLVYAWNDHKRMFQERQIRMAWDIHVEKGWIPAER
jgi:hypothetical protein